MVKVKEDVLIKNLNEKWSNKNCPMCGNNNWTVGKNLVTAVRISETGGIELGGSVMPLIAVTCNHCGNVIFINPLVIQAMEVPTNEEEK